MRRGLLSDYFKGAAVKRLSAVEADSSRSNQHEFNGVNALRAVFGHEQPRRFQTRFIWLGQEQEAIAEDGVLTWYDARDRHPTRSEYRLYFTTTAVSGLASAGDTMFIARRTDDSAMVIITPAGSSMENQLLWLFGLDEQPTLRFEAQEIQPDQATALDFAARYILDELGIELEEPEADQLDSLIERFGVTFPPSRDFSELARASLPDILPLDDPDEALLAWMEREEQLFRRMERRVVAERLRKGFAQDGQVDTDGFLQFSLSVQNRRKARAGAALENHLEALFTTHGIRFSRGAETEHRNRPDFLFPGQREYRDLAFPSARLTMLGAKSSLKDRWRQVLSEAERIPEKHLLTLEPGISENQTDEMRTKRLRLVVPRAIHDTYRNSQRNWIIDVAAFLALVRQRQEQDGA